MTAGPVAPPQRYAQQVTTRQAEVLYWLSLGFTVNGVARQLGVKPNTVLTLRRNLYRRLRVNNVAEAVRVGFELGLLTARPAVDAPLDRAVG